MSLSIPKSASISFSIPQSCSTPWGTIDPLIQAAIFHQLPHVEKNDLDLIYHYSITDSGTFTTIPGLSGLKRANIAEKIPQYPYLLHGIIAVAALHLRAVAVSEPEAIRSLYAERAATHQALALSSYIQRLHTMDEKSCQSIFTFSAILAGLEFGFLCSQDLGIGADKYINSVVHIFDLLLGAVAVANTASAWVPQCRPKPLATPIRNLMHREDGTFDKKVRHALMVLLSGIRQKDAESAHQKLSVIYNSAIPELWKAFRCLERKAPDNFKGAIGWPAFVDKAYVSLVKQRHPAALVVLAHYGVVLHSLDHTWWLRGVGAKLIQAIAIIMRLLNMEEWQDLLQWPLEQVGQMEHRSGQRFVTISSLLEDPEIDPPKPLTAFSVAFDHIYTENFKEI